MVSNATNATVNYGLPKFIAKDKPAWLVDWNNTMDEIDTLIKGASDNIADIQELLPQLQSAIKALETTVGDATAGLVKDVNSLKTTVGDSTSGLVKSVSDIQNDLITQNGLITNLDTRVTALENE